MTEAEEIQREWKYRYTERIGILCDDREPTVQQKQLAGREADEWEAAMAATVRGKFAEGRVMLQNVSAI